MERTIDRRMDESVLQDEMVVKANDDYKKIESLYMVVVVVVVGDGGQIVKCGILCFMSLGGWLWSLQIHFVVSLFSLVCSIDQSLYSKRFFLSYFC